MALQFCFHLLFHGAYLFLDDEDDDNDDDEDDIYMSVANNLSGTSSLESSMTSLSAGQQSNSSG